LRLSGRAKKNFRRELDKKKWDSEDQQTLGKEGDGTGGETKKRYQARRKLKRRKVKE